MSNQLPDVQQHGIFHRRFGDVVVTAISDGHIQAALGVFQGITAEQGEAELARAFRPSPPSFAVNVFVVRASGRTALIDAGGGDIYPAAGRMMAALAACSIAPESVDTVLLTHTHRDHVRGLVDAHNKVRFANARVLVHQADLDFFLDPAKAEGMPAPIATTFPVVEASLRPYGDQVVGFRGEVELFPSVSSVELPGHTPGHCGFAVGGRDGVLIWGDVMHLPEVQAAYPDATLVFDFDGAQAAASRRKTLELAASERLLVGGMHLHFPGLAHVVRRDAAFAVVPEPWTSAY